MNEIEALPSPLEGHPLAHLLVAGGRVVAANRAARRSFAVLDGGAPEPPLWAQLFADASPALPGDGELVRQIVGIRPGRHSRLELHGVTSEWRGASATLVVALEVDAADSAALALAESETDFRDMAENVPGALFRYLLRPDGTDAVLYMGPHCLDIWEVPASDVMRDATPLWTMILPEDLPAMQESVMRSARDLTPWAHEWRIVPASGVTKWLQAWGRPRRLDDGATLWNSFILDVTALKASQEAAERLRTERAKAQQLEALGRMAGGIAHDFNNLLTVILGMTQQALREAPVGWPHAAELGEVVVAARRAADLVRRLLAFARRQPTAPARVDPVAAVAELVPLLRRMTGPDVPIEVVTESVPPAVLIDPVQLDQCLTNLVTNARDAMPDGGRILLTLRAAGRDGRQGAAVSVQDSGIGMTAEVLAHLFEPFFTTKGGDRGTGLGMAVVAGVMDQAGGHVSIDSAPGSGTTVTLWLPAAEAPVAPAVAPAATALPRCVLLVEDEEQIRRFVARALEAEGVRVLVATTPTEAAALAGGPDGFDLLLTDIVLPGSSGIDLYRELSAVLGPVPVLFMSGYVAIDAVTAALDQQHHSVLGKPFTSEQLVEAVRSAFAAGRPTPHGADAAAGT